MVGVFGIIFCCVVSVLTIVSVFGLLVVVIRWIDKPTDCLICNGRCLHKERAAGRPRLQYPPDIF